MLLSEVSVRTASLLWKPMTRLLHGVVEEELYRRYERGNRGVWESPEQREEERD